MGVGGERHALAALPPGKRSGTHCRGGCVGPRAVLDGCGNVAPTVIRSPDRQLVASRYSYYAIPGPHVIVR